MSIQAFQLSTSGLIPNTTGFGNNISQQLPTFILLETNDTLATVTTAGYLNESKQAFQIPYSNQQVALVYTTDSGSVWLQVSVTGVSPNFTYSLVGTSEVSSVFIAASGSAAAPSYTFTGDLNTGIYHPAAHTIGFSSNGSEIAAISSTGLAVTGLVSATTTVTGGTGVTATTGNVTSTAGNLVAGSVTPHQGNVIIYPAASGGANDHFNITAITSGGNFTTTLENSAMGQATTFKLPDPGNAAGQVLVGATATPFVSGNFPKASGTAGLMVDSGISAASVTSGITVQMASGTLTSAQLTGMYATPVATVLTAPANGTAYLIHRWSLEYVFVTTAYATDAGSALLTYGSSAHAAADLATAGIALTGLFDQAASTTSAADGALTGLANTAIAATALYVSNTSTALSGAGADGTAKYYVWYSVITL